MDGRLVEADAESRALVWQGIVDVATTTSTCRGASSGATAATRGVASTSATSTTTPSTTPGHRYDAVGVTACSLRRKQI